MLAGSFIIWQLFSCLPKSRPSITVCIPSIPQDVKNGWLDACLRSIEGQKQQPAEIVVVISGCDEVVCAGVRERLLKLISGSRLKVITKATMLPPGQARNLAVKEASGEVISFFDADDIMHPHRLKIIKQYFHSRKNLQLLLHGCAGAKHSEKVENIHSYGKGYLCESEKQTRNEHLWLKSSQFEVPIAHGHMTVRRDVFDEFEFGYAPRGEDCMFIRQILQHRICPSWFLDAMYVDYALSAYTERRQKDSKLQLNNTEAS